MRCYYAKQADSVFSGGWMSVLKWARRAIKNDTAPVQLLSARGGEKFARVIAEVAREGERIIRNGRVINVKALRAKKL